VPLYLPGPLPGIDPLSLDLAFNGFTPDIFESFLDFGSVCSVLITY
jgi:hypothetical protein